MNGTAAKKFRKELRQKIQETETQIAMKFKQWINVQPFSVRFQIALRIVRGRF